jgi:hypothetical protein
MLFWLTARRILVESVEGIPVFFELSFYNFFNG